MAASRVALGSSPYAHPEVGTLGGITRIGRKDVIALHSRVYQPKNALFVVAGPLPAADIFALAEKTFGDWIDSRFTKHPRMELPDQPASRHGHSGYERWSLRRSRVPC